MDPTDRSALVQRLAWQAGFARVGIAPAGPLARIASLDDWLARGWAGQMEYLARHRDLRADPRKVLPGARSVIVVADLYHQPPPPESQPPNEPRGRVAQYAWGRDYHRVVRAKLIRLTDQLRACTNEPFNSRICVDTAPVLERELAAAAGIGWIGKNTLVINADMGSLFFLGEIITTLELAPTAPVTDRCGTCTRCLDACPTGALVAPYQMDARRCIAYLTIEYRGDIPAELQPRMHDWVFGCDVCQEVCPYNRSAPLATESAYAPNPANPLAPRPLLSQLLVDIYHKDFNDILKHSAMTRATPAMLSRNAEIALRNLQAGRVGTALEQP